MGLFFLNLPNGEQIMSKKVLCILIGGLSTTAIAQTNVTIYGIADVSGMGVNQSNVKNPAGKNYGGNTFSLVNNTSYMGFKGVEDLGNGVKALFQAETNLGITGTPGAAVSYGTSNSVFTSLRDSYVGLSGKYGVFMGGYMSTPVRAVVAGSDVMPGGTGPSDITKQMTSIRLGAPIGGTQYSSAIRSTGIYYAMPTMYGVDASVMYTGSNNNGTNNTSSAGSCTTPSAETSACSITPQSAFGFNLGWTGYGVKVQGAFQQALNRTTPVAGTNISNYGDYTTYLVAAAYTGVPGLKLSTLYARNTLGTFGNTLATPTGAGKLTNNQLWAGAAYRMGNWEPRVSASWSSDLNGSAVQQLGSRQWTFNLAHHFSKRTQVYGVISNLNNSANQTYTLGLQTSQLGTTSATSGSNLFTYGLGLRTSF
jgi:predicted porin